MVGKGAKLLLPLIGLVVLLQSSCADGAAPEPGPGNQANDRISITNDAATLATISIVKKWRHEFEDHLKGRCAYRAAEVLATVR